MPPRYSNQTNGILKFLQVASDAKQEWQAKAWVASEYYEGRGYYGLRYDYGNSVTPVIDTEVQRGMVLDIAPRTIDSLHSTMTQVPMRPEAVASSSDPEDARGALAGTMFLRDHWRRNDSETRRQRMSKSLMITGAEFLRFRWDESQRSFVTMSAEQLVAYEQETGIIPDKAERIGESNMYRAILQTGGTTEHRVPGNLVFAESGPEEWSEVTRFAVMDYPSIHKLKMDYPESADKIKALMIQDSFGSSNGNSTNYMNAYRNDTDIGPVSFSEEFERTQVCHYWEKDANGWQFIVLTGDQLDVVLDSGASPINPYVMYSCKTTRGLWGKSFFSPMVGPAYAVNALYTQQMVYFGNQIKNIIMLPFGAKVDQITNEFNTIFRYDGSMAPPIFKNADSTIIQMHMQLIEQAKQELLFVGQSSDIAFGEVKSRTSRAAIQEAKESYSTPLLEVRRRMMNSEKEASRIILAFDQQFATVPRIMQLVGSANRSAAAEFKAADISIGTDIDIVETDESPKGQEARLDTAIQLSRYGLFQDDPASMATTRNILKFAKHGQIGDLDMEEERVARDEARMEQQAIVDGKVIELPLQMVGDLYTGEYEQFLRPNLLGVMSADGTPTTIWKPEQLHDVHIDEHNRFLKDPTKPESSKAQLRYHIYLEHTPYRDFIQQQQKQQELEFRRQMSLADAAGPMAQTVVQATASEESEPQSGKPKGTPTSGGQNSGRTRSRQAVAG